MEEKLKINEGGSTNQDLLLIHKQGGQREYRLTTVRHHSHSPPPQTETGKARQRLNRLLPPASTCRLNRHTSQIQTHSAITRVSSVRLSPSTPKDSKWTLELFISSFVCLFTCFRFISLICASSSFLIYSALT